MKYFLISLFILIMSLTSAQISCADEIQTNNTFNYEYSAQIVAVDVYPSGAKFTFKFTPADSKFEFALPGAFNADSVRIVDAQNSNANIQAVQMKRSKWIPDELKDLKSKLDSQNSKISELNSTKTALEQTLELLDEVKPKEPDSKSILNYIKEAQVLRLETNNALLKINDDISKEKDILNILNSEFNSRKPYNDSLFVLVTGNSDSEFLFEAFTTSATWKPHYTLDLNTDTGEIDAHMFAKIFQKTGLNFDGDLILHTKYPDENIVEPSLKPLQVSLRPKIETSSQKSLQRNYMPMHKMMAVGAAREEMAMDSYLADEEIEEDFSAPEVPVQRMTETLSDRVIELTGSLTGDGKESDFEIDALEIEMKSEPVILLIPEQRKTAWIIASMDESNTKLIPGEAVLRVDGYPSGKTVLKDYGNIQKKMPFGYIEQISAEKNSLIEKTSSSSWFGSSQGRSSGYEIKVTNSTQQDRKVIVQDRLPVVTNDKIERKIKNISPAETSRSKDDILTWELELEPGETKSIIVDYSLSYPSSEILEYK